jgi:hypothetical protein
MQESDSTLLLLSSLGPSPTPPSFLQKTTTTSLDHPKPPRPHTPAADDITLAVQNLSTFSPRQENMADSPLPEWYSVMEYQQDQLPGDHGGTLPVYSKTAYKKDALFITYIVNAIAQRNGFRELATEINQSDFQTAKAIVACLDPVK